MMSLPPSVELEEIGAGYPSLRMRHPRADARIALHGGHVMEWIPAGHQPMLYLSPRAVFSPGKAIRGGVPVCWPWFGAHRIDAGLPAHGFARGRFWEWGTVDEREDGVSVRMELRDDAGTRSIWPHEFRLVMVADIGATLTITLVTHNTGDRPFALGAALHTYLRVGDIMRSHIDGLDGAEYLDTVGPRESRRQGGPVTFGGEVDRIFRHRNGCRLLDGAWGRQVSVNQQGAKDLVVWNPWVEKTGRLDDLPPDGFRHFVCLEAANADGDLPVLPPGAQHTLRTIICPSRA
ncbi:MAG TPA: D-hexose-6-phosphate mutarotase [Verrucomicrobiae bacterium]|nr:D-hexose-6-phosphate mutarotase [Verrucomicrobiae bacterium]